MLELLLKPYTNHWFEDAIRLYGTPCITKLQAESQKADGEGIAAWGNKLYQLSISTVPNIIQTSGSVLNKKGEVQSYPNSNPKPKDPKP